MTKPHHIKKFLKKGTFFGENFRFSSNRPKEPATLKKESDNNVDIFKEFHAIQKSKRICYQLLEIFYKIFPNKRKH